MLHQSISTICLRPVRAVHAYCKAFGVEKDQLTTTLLTNTRKQLTTKLQLHVCMDVCVCACVRVLPILLYGGFYGVHTGHLISDCNSRNPSVELGKSVLWGNKAWLQLGASQGSVDRLPLVERWFLGDCLITFRFLEKPSMRLHKIKYYQ